MTPRETLSDLLAAGIPRDEAIRMAREEHERQKANKRNSPHRELRHAWDRRGR